MITLQNKVRVYQPIKSQNQKGENWINEKLQVTKTASTQAPQNFEEANSNQTDTMNTEGCPEYQE